MSSRSRQTLSQYLKRHQDKKTSHKQHSSRIKVKQNCENELAGLIQRKRDKAIKMMENLLAQTKKGFKEEKNSNTALMVLEKAIKEIKQDFDQILKSHIRSRSRTPEFIYESQQTKYEILINNQPLEQQLGKNQLSQILIQRKNNHKSHQQSIKTISPLLTKTPQIMNIVTPLVKKRSHKSKQNSSSVLKTSNHNPQTQHQQSSQDFLNKGFDKKQLRLINQRGNGLSSSNIYSKNNNQINFINLKY